MPTAVPIPAELVAAHRRSREGITWIKELPDLLQGALTHWRLSVDLADGAIPWSGNTGIVVPVRTAGGRAAALKVAFPFDEVLLEPLALKLWDGVGAVRLLDHDAQNCAMVIDRLDAGKSLISVSIDQAISQWGATLKQLSIPVDNRAEWREIPRIADTAERYSDELPQLWEELGRPFDRWLLEAALEVCQTRGAIGRRSANDVLVHTDLHYLNILRTLDAGGYLAIDPQAQVGEAEFAVAPCLWNRLRDLPEGYAAEAGLRRRNEDLCAAAGLDADVAAQWAVLREVENALAYFSEGDSGGAQRSLWVASTMAGRTLPELPQAYQLNMLD